MADFSQYLSTAVDSIEAPKPLPVGHYFATAVKWASVESNEKKIPMIRVDFKTTGPDSDVDVDGVDPTTLVNRNLNNNFILNNEFGPYQLRQMFEAMGLDTKGLSLQDGLDQIAGQPVKLYVAQRTLPNGEIVADVKKILSAE